MDEYHWLKRLSWSGYNIYKGCPDAYYRHYVVNQIVKSNTYNVLGGKTIQRVFELFYNNEIWRRGPDAQQILYDILDKEYKILSIDPSIDWNAIESRKTSEELLESIKPLIPSTLRVIKDYKLLGKYAKSEVKVHAWIDKTLVHGIADFIIRRDNDHILLDGKLTKHRSKFLKRDQLVWYTLLFYLQYHTLMNKVGWIYYSYGELEWVPISVEDINRLHMDIKDTITLIKKKKFDATPSDRVCNFCDYKNVCEHGKQKKKQQQKQRMNKQIEIYEKTDSPLLKDNDEIGF